MLHDWEGMPHFDDGMLDPGEEWVNRKEEPVEKTAEQIFNESMETGKNEPFSPQDLTSMVLMQLAVIEKLTERLLHVEYKLKVQGEINLKQLDLNSEVINFINESLRHG